MEINQNYIKKFDRLFHEIIFLNQKDQLPDGMAELSDMNPLDTKILNIIFERPDTTIQEINSILKISGSTLTSAIKRLESKDIVARTICREDMRSYILRLTARGIELQKTHKNYEHILFNKILSCLDSEEEIENFLVILDKIILKIEKEFPNVGDTFE